ncbi:MAG TPA: prepilin-type N-terminal cleavage/methylation domain-containing protein [Thermoanaerobaculia bacterium]|nr:prepilin-type N-terminal cleavage/methylation domain-containing protein [Thermoanaerobaculia bacterium]
MTALRQRRAQAGFTLVELAVSTLLLLLVLVIAHGLLVESARILRASAERALRPEARLALRQLGRDIRAAPPRSTGPLWTSAPLDLALPEGVGRWERAGESLVRRRFAPDGSNLGARPMLDDVVAFRWRTPVPGLLEVEVVRRAPVGSPELRAATALWARDGEALERTVVVASSRRGGIW